MTVLKGLLQELNNPYATIAEDGLVCGDISGYIDTGIYTLNALISGKMINGGFPKGKVTALAGEKGTGKTYLLLNSLRKYLIDNPKGEVVFFESEGALTKDILVERGIDITRVSIIPISTVEELRNQTIKVLDFLEREWEKTDEYPEIVMCLDSLGMLGTEFEINTSRVNDNKADMGKRSQLIKSVFRIITLKLSLLQIPFILTNHTYESMSAYSGKQMSGGSGLGYASSITVFMTKSKVKDGKSKIQNLSGGNINCVLEKGRQTIEGSKISLHLDFKNGISKYSGILIPLISAGIFEKKGAWISYDGENVAQGDNKFYKNVSDIVTDEILITIGPFIEKQFLYGVYNK